MTKKGSSCWFKMTKGMLLCMLLLLLIGCDSSSVQSSEEKATQAETELFAMDTYMKISAYGENSEEAVEQSEDEIEKLDTLLDSGDKKSRVYEMNQEGQGQAEEDIRKLLKNALEISESTDGDFDITVYPLIEEWGFISKEYKVPTEAELKQRLPLVGFQGIVFDEASGEYRYEKEGMKIDFGGIAKGYASDKIVEIMKENGIESALITLGGNIQALGSKSDGSPWRIAIQNPDGSQKYLGVVSVKDKAVITSGGYERYFEEGGTVYHHILDPKTGKPAESDLTSVTIVSSRGVLGDGLSTALFVKGLEEAENYWRAHSEEFDVILLDSQGYLHVSQGISDSFESDFRFEIIEK